jgi:ribosome recycling factor
MLDDIKKDARERMLKCVQNFQADMKKLRTGRAHPSLIEHLKVDYYGNDTPLNQVANIAVEDGRTLVVSPWERTMVQPIEKAIHKSDLGLNPLTAGAVIRIPMPALTEERRRDIMTAIKDQLKKKLISQDDEKRAEVEIQKLTDKHIADIEQALTAKEKEVMQV